jgi:xanthine dehydrogenase YagS FAD-binding subunit
MMTNFGYFRAGSLAEAIKALSARGAKLHAGGTDLLGCARDEVFQVDKIVSISRIKELHGISSRPDGGVKIGATSKLAEIAASKVIAEKYPALARAAAEVGTPQIREQGSVGGNLCQRPRCWYFRSDLRCLKKGGATCFAVNGENQYHAIFGGGPCFCVHPSDLAVALAALQAQLTIAGPSGNRAVRLADFFVGPKKAIDKENVLLPGEILTEVHLPPASGKTKSSFRKVRARGSWDFALASAATLLQLDGETVRSARIVLGGVAPYPWRVEAAEKILTGKKLDANLAMAAADAAVMGATPLKGNGYKVEIVKGAVEESLVSLM